MGTRIQKALFLFIALYIFPVAIFAQTGEIKGKICNQKNNEPIPFVNIIIDGKPTQGTTTDMDGNYRISGVEPGYVRLVATAVGFKKTVSQDVLVTRSHPVVVNIGMEELVLTLSTIEVRPSVIVRKTESPLSLQTLTIQEIEKSPGSNRDISKVIQSLPGVASGVSYRNDLIIRGGGPNENRYYLDGIEIPNINHFATQGASGGSVGIINVDFIRDVELYTGAFPARRGNALSSVMELQQIDAAKDKFGGRLTVGATDFGLTLDGPVTKHSTLLFSIRRSYLKMLFSILKLPFLPTYNDYQLKYKIDLGKHDQISLISLGSLDNSKLNTGIKDPTESQRYILGYLPEYTQWSYTFGLVYRHFTDKGSHTFVLSRNMLDNEEIKYKNNVEIPDSLNLNYKSQEIENKFRYEGLSSMGSWKISYGAGLDYVVYNNTTFQKLYAFDNLKLLNYTSTLNFYRWNIFSQANKSLANNRLNLSLGIRMDAASYSKEMNNLPDQLSPRFSASWAILTDKLFLNFNTGRYYQLPAYTTLGYRNNNGTLVNDSLGLKYIAADHVVIGMEYIPKPNSKISLEGFYKYYSHYPLSIRDSISLASKGTDFGAIGDEAVIPVSKGRAYGLELFWRDADLYKFNIIVSYTYVRSEFTDFSGNYIPSSWDYRHLLNITIGRKFRHDWQLGLKWRFAGGAPYTPYNIEKSSRVEAWDALGQGYLDYSKYNSLRLRNFNELDLRVDKAFYFRKWSLMVYLDIQNLLNTKSQEPDIVTNTLSDGSIRKYIDNQGIERYELRSLPHSTGTILPAIGVMVDF
ncbi:MAG: TonB-dependent receptor [Bacteroidota bacterium]|nr:TonB-dependent receptor [Bacteroidota bacterium]